MSQIKVSGISQVIKGKKVTIDLDVGFKYLKLHIDRTAFTALEAVNYKLKINGKVRQELGSLKDIENINTHYSRPQTADVTTIYFNRPELADSEDRNQAGLGTRDIKSLQVEFDLLGTIAGTPEIEVVADVTTNENIGWITKYEIADVDLAKVGKNVVSKMPVGDGNVFNYFITKATNDITDINLYRVVDGQKTSIIDSTKAFLEVDQKQAPMRPRVPVTATITSLDFVVEGIPEHALQTNYVQLPNTDFLTAVERIGMDITVGTAEVVTLVTESVGQFRG